MTKCKIHSGLFLRTTIVGFDLKLELQKQFYVVVVGDDGGDGRRRILGIIQIYLNNC